jgi:DNA processing protein
MSADTSATVQPGMSADASATAQPGGACVQCLRRSWLLSTLSGALDCCARDRERLIELLALQDETLIAAVAGRRRKELRTDYARFGGDGVAMETGEPGVETVCRHRRGYPRALDGAHAPHMLELAGGTDRFAELASAPAVALLGSRRASDYGIEMARSLARGLAASGVTVLACFADGIAAAAHAGALDAHAGSVAVMGGGLAVACPARRRALYQRVIDAGCAISELPARCPGRRWGQLASERTVAALADVAVLVEAHDTAEELFAARVAGELGRAVAALPGRVTSALSCGTHALLLDGAHLVRGAQDVLELLYAREGSSARSSPHPPAARTAEPEQARALGLRRELRTVLARVGAGCDTPDSLAHGEADAGEVLLALSELELMGLLVRGDGGRYLPRDPRLDW